MEYELRITGMHCTGCAQSIERYLSSDPAVRDATVSYDAAHGKVSVSPDAEIERLVDVIERMGYETTILNSE